MNASGSKTIHNYLIKQTAENIYRIYIDDDLVHEVGSQSAAVNLLAELMRVDSMLDDNKTEQIEFYRDIIEESCT